MSQFRLIIYAPSACFKSSMWHSVGNLSASKATRVENRYQISDFSVPCKNYGRGGKNVWLNFSASDIIHLTWPWSAVCVGD